MWVRWSRPASWSSWPVCSWWSTGDTRSGIWGFRSQAWIEGNCGTRDLGLGTGQRRIQPERSISNGVVPHQFLSSPQSPVPNPVVMRTLTVWVPVGFPDVRPGDDLSRLIPEIFRFNDVAPEDLDVLVVAQKVVSKAEGSVVNLDEVTPGPRALQLAEEAKKDPRLCQVILNESRAVLRVRPGLIIAEHRLGFICANAGVDHSNVGLGPQWVATLPKNPDASAEAIRQAIAQALGARVGVIINDTHGRPFREGAVGVAIGLAGMEPLYSYIGEQDLYGYVLQTSVESVADELASAASLLQGQAAEGTPLALIRGVRIEPGRGGARRALRAPAKDRFRWQNRESRKQKARNRNSEAGLSRPVPSAG